MWRSSVKHGGANGAAFGRSQSACDECAQESTAPDLARWRDKAGLRRELGLPQAGFLFLFIGRMVRCKGFRHVIEAAGRLPRTRGDWRIVAVGDGPDIAALRKLAEAHQIAERLHWVGKSSMPEKYYAAATPC